ncbi:MAG: AbrB/MazE/SpoVT family DNA-binding domain-containing protein [Verrucomicrobiae bacterium]|nr:AbrB/MazE/SpoVT family DNA-binding domain-containing protein [Verrucomicrobiae bacterium]
MTTVLSEKGQITIPKALRDQLGLKAGSILDFETIDGKLVATKKMPGDVFDKWCGRGRLPACKATDDYLELIRHGHVR